MKYYLSIMLLASLFCFSLPATGQASSVFHTDLSRFFAGYEGTFVLYDEDSDQYTIYNEQQSQVRLSPCSTFKIANSLIGLESGVLAKDDALTRLPWNGHQYSIPAWNRDHTLASAMANSVVWYYQEVARRIGPARMQESVNKLHYGNQDISGGIDRFWLESSLKISAREQVELLKQLYNDKLPFAPENMAVVRKIMVQSAGDNLVFSGKTGSAYQNGQYVLGWFVGAVEKNGHKYFFATNIQNGPDAQGSTAREISRQILTELELL